jgi:hypothetical protein
VVFQLVRRISAVTGYLMNVRNRHLLFVFLIFLINLSFSMFTYADPNGQSHKLDTSIYYFKFDNGCRLTFGDSWIYLGNSNGLWSWLDDDGIKFYNLRMASSECPNPWHIRISGQASLTITKLFENKRFIATINAPSGTTSTTKIYCGDKGQPITVYSINGTLSWDYNTSNKILTVNVLHDSPARTLVYWRLPGDVDGDGDVDPYDFCIFSGAYGTRKGDPAYNPEADLDGDGNINSNDFYTFAEDYGKTEP